MTQIGINDTVGGTSAVKVNGNGRSLTPKGVKAGPKAVTPEQAKARALEAFVTGLGAFHKASVSCKVLILAAVQAGCTRPEMIEAGVAAGFEEPWVAQVVRTEAGLRERAFRSDKGSAKNPHAKAVYKHAVDLAGGDVKLAASALLAAYKLAKKALAK